MLNAGVSGTNVHHSLNVFVNKGITRAPDFVIVMHAVNDCALLMTRGGYDDWMVQPLWGGPDGWGPVRTCYELATSYSSGLGFLRHLYSVHAISRGQAHLSEHANAIDVKVSQPVDVKVDAFDVRLRMLVAAIRAAHEWSLLPYQGRCVHPLANAPRSSTNAFARSRRRMA